MPPARFASLSTTVLSSSGPALRFSGRLAGVMYEVSLIGSAAAANSASTEENSATVFLIARVSSYSRLPSVISI